MDDNKLKQQIERLHAHFNSKYEKSRQGDSAKKTQVIAGFNMPYSPASTWDIANDTLILTINPKAQEHRAKNESDKPRKQEFIPESVWQTNNDFYAEDFSRRKCFQRAFEQIAAAFGDAPEKAKNGYAIWSVVPFRTENENKIPEELWKDALYSIWGPLFGLWQPRNICVLGARAYDVIKDAVSMHAFFIREEKGESGAHYPRLRNAKYRSPAGKVIDVFGLPHPSRFCSFYTGESSAAYKFIVKMRQDEEKQALCQSRMEQRT